VNIIGKRDRNFAYADFRHPLARLPLRIREKDSLKKFKEKFSIVHTSPLKR
jgi:hypothetical protein